MLVDVTFILCNLTFILCNLTCVHVGEDIEITYSYWDGSGHRRSVTVSAAPPMYHGHQRADSI